jgi:hypothetical protein
VYRFRTCQSRLSFECLLPLPERALSLLLVRLWKKIHNAQKHNQREEKRMSLERQYNP